MKDSDNKAPEQPEKNMLPAVSEEVIVHSQTGKTRIMLRGEGGKFQKKKKSMPKTEDITRYMRELLNKVEAGPDGRMTKRDKTRFRRMFDNIFNIASMSPEQPVFDKLGNIVWTRPPVVDENEKIVMEGIPMTVKDAKIAMASTQAFKELMLRAYGMPSKSDEEIDAMKKEGVKIVVIAPPEMVNKEIVEEKPRELMVPSFIDAEFVENK